MSANVECQKGEHAWAASGRCMDCHAEFGRPLADHSGAADWLERGAEADMAEVERLTAQIEALERDIVRARHRRIEAARRAAEARAAANILRANGLRSEIVDGIVNVSVKPSVVTPDPDTA